MDFAWRSERSLSCGHSAEQTEALPLSLPGSEACSHRAGGEDHFLVTSWCSRTPWFPSVKPRRRRHVGRLAASPPQPLRLQPLAEILIMFDSCFTYENKHMSPAFLPPPAPPQPFLSGRHPLGMAARRQRQEQAMRTKRESRLPSARREKMKKIWRHNDTCDLV